MGFKPYYKWITFNTPLANIEEPDIPIVVLNLIINGLPSILIEFSGYEGEEIVLNLIINGLPSIL